VSLLFCAVTLFASYKPARHTTTDKTLMAHPTKLAKKSMTLCSHHLIVTASIACFCAGYQAFTVHAQTASAEERTYADAHRFYRTLIDGLATGNRRDVVDLFRYPLQVRVLGLSTRLVAVKDAAAMLKMYPLFLGPQFRCAMEDRPLVADGVLSMAGGTVIAQRTNGVFKITRLTVSLEAPTRSTAPVPVLLPMRGQKQLGGRLAQDGLDNYVVSAQAGDRLSVALERFRGRALSIRVYNQRTKGMLKGAATEYARRWNARIPTSGNYVVQIQRRVPYCEPDVTYLLTIALQ
jgi:hypothetical protein